MSVALTLQQIISVVETLETNVPAAGSSSKNVTHTAFNRSSGLSASTTPPVTKCAFLQKALSAGAGTIDLTAVTGTNGATVDFSGLKVQAALFHNPAANANAITVTFGASNAYLLAGSAWKVILQPGESWLYHGNDASPDVSGTTKNIDIAGTGSQALNVGIVAG